MRNYISALLRSYKYSSGYKNEVGTKQTDIEYVRLLIKTFLPFLKSLKDDGNLIVNLATKKIKNTY